MPASAKVLQLGSLAVLGCSEPQAPTLPGEEQPRCELTAPRQFLITDLAVPDGLPFPIDLVVPPQDQVGSLNYPFVLLKGITEKMLLATKRAVIERRVLWIVGLQTCAGIADPYIRMSLRRGDLADDTTVPPTVSIAPELYVWSIGESSSQGYDANYGKGPVPINVGIDAQADTSEPGWIEAFAISIRARVLSSTQISGEIALAVKTTTAMPAISMGVANTLASAHAEHPECPGSACPDEQLWLGRLVSMFDSNGDRSFSGSEVRNSGYLDGALGLRPRLDLLSDDNGREVYWPDHDDILESHESSYTFTATEVTVLE